MSKVFKSLSKNLRPNEKHFFSVLLSLTILDDDSFADITFEDVYASKIQLIHSNAFNVTSSKLRQFFCVNCAIQHQPPKYSLNNVLNQMSQLQQLTIGLNVTELPTIQPIDNQTSLDRIIIFNNQQNLTIKSGSFQLLKSLFEININNSTINAIEKQAFKLDANLDYLELTFTDCNFTNGSMQIGSFDGIPQETIIRFLETDISYLAESIFKPVLSNQLSYVGFTDNKSPELNQFNCDDCRNYWLIRDNKQDQIKNAFCKGLNQKTLFHQEIQLRLSQKCK